MGSEGSKNGLVDTKQGIMGGQAFGVGHKKDVYLKGKN